MTSRPELREQYELIASIQPTLHYPQNWTYDTSHAMFKAYTHPLHDVGGQPDVPVCYEEREEEDWGLRAYVLCETLGWKGVWNSEERRRRADVDIGYTQYLGIPYYGRWLLAAARMLVDNKHIKVYELQQKIEEVRARYVK